MKYFKLSIKQRVQRKLAKLVFGERFGQMFGSIKSQDGTIYIRDIRIENVRIYEGPNGEAVITRIENEVKLVNPDNIQK